MSADRSNYGRARTRLGGGLSRDGVNGMGYRGSAVLATPDSSTSSSRPTSAKKPKAAAVKPEVGVTRRAAAAAKAPPRCPRVVHPVVAAAISQTVVLSACIPHVTVSHRLLEYLVPHFMPATSGVDVTALGTTRASQLLGDMTVSSSEFVAVVTSGTRVRGTLTITSAYRDDLPDLRRLCGPYLTSLDLHLRSNFHLPRGRSTMDRPGKEKHRIERQALAESAAAFGHMRCLKHLAIRGSVGGAALDAATACVAAVLPRLEQLKLIIHGELNFGNLLRLAVPNSLLHFTIGVTATTTPRLNFDTPSFAFWRFFNKLGKLTIVRCSIGPEFLEGAAAALTSFQSLDLSTSRLEPGCEAALTAFPESLEEIAYGGWRGPEALAAYPHLTYVHLSCRGRHSLGDVLAEGCNTVEAFKRRSAHRRSVRERAVRAALTNLDLCNAPSEDGTSDADHGQERNGRQSACPELPVAEWKPRAPDRGPPMVVDVSTGNAFVPGVGSLQSLRTGAVKASDLESLGAKFRSLRRLKTIITRHDCRGLDLSSWSALRHLHTVELTGPGVAPHNKNLIEIVRKLSVVDVTLRVLAVPGCSLPFFLAVASYLPQLATLRIDDGRVAPAITPTMQRVVLLRAGVITCESTKSGRSGHRRGRGPRRAFANDRTSSSSSNISGDTSNGSSTDDGSDGQQRSGSASSSDDAGVSDSDESSADHRNDDDDGEGGVDSDDGRESAKDEVSAAVAASVLGVFASRPRPTAPTRARRSTLPPVPSITASRQSGDAPPQTPPVLDFRQSGVVRLDSVAVERLLGRPRLLHTLRLTALDVDAVAGLALLYPKLVLLESCGLTAGRYLDSTFTVECLRPYWPSIAMRPLS